MAVSLFGSAHIGAPAHTSCNHASSAKEFRQWSARVWNPAHWKRKQPKQSTIQAERRQLACAGPANKRAIKKTWRRDQRTFYKHRKLMLYRAKIEPFYGCTVGGCGWWAIPAWSANCESGGGAVASNIYGNLANYRGGSKWEQSVTAYELLLQNGGQNQGTYEQVWLQWEGGCSGYPGEGWSPDR